MPVNGNALLHQSTITNAPELTAQSKVWTVTGSGVAPGGLGVAAWDGTNSYREYVTFPTDPLYYEAPAALSARAQSPETINVESGVNGQGQSFGSGEGVESDADLPDLVAAIGTNGEVGYIDKNALRGPAATPAEAVASDPGNRTVPLYDKDGHSVIGEFAIS